jgi:hypothetical protein
MNQLHTFTLLFSINSRLAKEFVSLSFSVLLGGSTISDSGDHVMSYIFFCSRVCTPRIWGVVWMYTLDFELSDPPNEKDFL